ncbi:MAG: EF-hand domain-containing protein [Steroidobacteraceae bacterium]
MKALPLLTLLAVVPAFGQTPPKAVPLATTFEQIDTNHDGKLSLAETQAKNELRKAFETLDKDSDGYLSPAEFGSWAGAAPTKPTDPSTAPGGSSNAQHMPKLD